MHGAFGTQVDPHYWAQYCNIRAELQCQLLHELFEIPHRRRLTDPSRIAQAEVMVPGLAHMAYEGQRFQDLPILADALEESGCPDQDILSHLRGSNPHVHGCWALDALIGKS